MTTVEVFLLTAFVMTTFTESKTLAQAEKKTTCGIRGLGTSDMMLTCYFHHNVNALQKDFTVYLYKGEGSPMEVVSCQWTPEVSCSVAPGYEYEYDGDVNRDHTNVRILKAATEHVGMYTCQVIGERNPGTCSLTEEQIQKNSLSTTPHTKLTSTTLPAQTTTTTTTTTTTSVIPDDRQSPRKDEQNSASSQLSDGADVPGGRLAEELQQTSLQGNILIYVVPSVSLIVFLIILVIVLGWRRHIEARRRRRRDLVSHSALTTGHVDACDL
ncbi:uncharacterized protein LOC112567706 isoform X3 [Pomacea canaliculata]|uniref:uncharacterized protein LOC112567706 isoform X3 n=1 Tax=Pomacea canaliculata TaxID=400727 RepID=UPI000D72CCF9|nr:uncharacterized protein LOC112567706 isoform X3 [Pomacea canaliculata]